MRQWPKQKMHRHPVSPTRVLLLVFFDLLKVSKIIFDLFKVSKVTTFFDLLKVSKIIFDLFKVIKITTKFLTSEKYLLF